MSQLPKVSHLQFLVLGVLRAGPRSGREVRDELESFGARVRGPAFYQMMARLEDGGLVEGEYHQEVVESQIIRERHYRVTADGSTAWTEASEFYREALRAFGAEEGLAGA